MKRTIVCLAAKRSGTTALHRIFSKHPDVGICHPDQDIDGWEPSFWNYAAAALNDDFSQLVGKSEELGLTPYQQFVERMKETAPMQTVPSQLTEQAVFDLWDTVIDTYGPIVFDKTPNYLSSRDALELLLKYRENGNDVRIFGIVRDPRDVIASQYTHWKDVAPHRTPEVREQAWIEACQSFEWVQERLGEENCPLFRYEELSADANKWVPRLLKYCGLEDLTHSYAHIKPVSIGRFFISRDREIRSWIMGDDFKKFAACYGYDLDQNPGTVWRIVSSFKSYFKQPMKRARRIAGRIVRTALGAMLHPVVDRLSTSGYGRFLLGLVSRRVKRLSPEERLRFLFDLDHSLYEMEGQAATAYGNGVHTKHRHTRYHDFFVERIEKGLRVVDIGCGGGELSWDMAERSQAHVVGIDMNEGNIHRAQEHRSHPRVEYIHGDALSDLPEKSCDVVVMSNVLEHLSGRWRFLALAQERLTPDRFLIRVPLFERDWRVPLQRELGVEWRLDPTHKTEYTLESFADEMAQAGLVVTHQEVRWGEVWAEVRARSFD